MTTFILTRKHTGTVANEVWFYYSIMDAMDEKERLEEETQAEWMIAEEVDFLDGWFGMFLKWLRAKLS